MTRQTKIITGVLAGAALGATIALVFSANKNNEIKEKVSDWLADLLVRSKDKLAGAGMGLKGKMAKVKV